MNQMNQIYIIITMRSNSRASASMLEDILEELCFGGAARIFNGIRAVMG